MTILKKSFVVLTLSSFFGICTCAAQETEKPQDVSARIDSIVQSVFQRIDDQLGTYIFRDEPQAISEEDSLGALDENVGISHARHSTYWRHHRESSLYSFEPWRGIKRNATVSYPWGDTNGHLLFRYNRVEGLFLGLNSPETYRWQGRHISLFGSGGYGFAAHRWRYSGGVAQQFGAGKSMLEFGIEGHSLTDTRDQWIIDEDENTLAAFFLRYDYRDYYARKGFSIWTGNYWRWRNSDLQFRVAYLDDRYESLSQSADWAMFGGDTRFRLNPAVDEGRMRSVLTTLDFHAQRERRYFFSGWSASASAELSPKGLKGDFDFYRYLVDLRGYLSLGDYENFNLRFRTASSTGEVPFQKAFDLGGIGTLPVFDFKEFVGNRLLLGNVEYVVNGKIIDDAGLFPSWLLRNVNLIFFVDAGYITTVGSEQSVLDGFDRLSFGTTKWDWGVGIGSRDGKMRLALAWRTDVAKPAKVFIRVSRPF
jgi:outer membrane protein assembly factor BamA